MKNRLIIFLLLSSLSACSFSETQSFASSTPSVPKPSLWLTFTPSPIPSTTVSPTLTSTPTVPPYTGNPFSIVFIRGGNLWIAHIGQKVTERQLTFESSEMRVISFDVAPDGTRVAYIPYQLEPLNSLVKMLDLSTGETRVILGKDDPFSETCVIWAYLPEIAYQNHVHLVACCC